MTSTNVSTPQHVEEIARSVLTACGVAFAAVEAKASPSGWDLRVTAPDRGPWVFSVFPGPAASVRERLHLQVEQRIAR
jgi:hypothetical protein